MEVMIVMVIIAIVGVMGMDAIADYETSQRPQRAAGETLAFFRYARHLAMTTGKKAKVQINTTSNTVSVYWMSNGTTYDTTPVTNALGTGNVMTLNINSGREYMGTTITTTPSSATTYEYWPLGQCVNTGSITFSNGSKTSTMTIPAVGDPAIN